MQPDLPNPESLGWRLTVRTKPSTSKAGHPVPYLLSGAPVARPLKWPHSPALWLLYALGGVLPLALASHGVLVLANKYRLSLPQWLAYRLKRLAYWSVTRYRAEGSEDPVQVALMFDEEPYPSPIDAGMVEPVIVLNAMGIGTSFCCEGHQGGFGDAYLRLRAGRQFPGSLLDALASRDVSYRLDAQLPDRGEVLYAKDGDTQLAFSQALREWAREQAPAVLDMA